jgi:hypothetical protein
MCKSEYNDPRLVNRIAFEYVKRVHRRNSDIVRLMGQREGGQLGGQLSGGGFIPRFRSRNEVRICVGGEKGVCGSWTAAGTLAGHFLQLAVRVLVGRMPEEWRRTTRRGLAQSINRIARNPKKGQRFRFGSETLSFGAFVIDLLWNDSPPGKSELI